MYDELTDDHDLTSDRTAHPSPRVIRSSSRWRTLQRRFKSHCQRVNAGCYWCTLRGDQEMAAIDYHASANSPHSFEADHLQPLESNPELAYDWANLVPSHSRCNRQKGAKSPAGVARVPHWVKPDW